MMKTAIRDSLVLLIATFIFEPLVSRAQQAKAAPAQMATDVRKHLLSLPYYGVFDLLTFNVETTV